MNLLEQTCAAIQPVDREAARLAQQYIDDKTKPLGSLGVLENLAVRLASIHGMAQPPLPKKAIVVMAADHGVTAEGVSAYPAEVTAQMLANFCRGGAAINVLARHAGARVIVVDMGTREGGRGREPAPHTNVTLRNAWLGPGTLNISRGPAMTMVHAQEGITTGIRLAEELAGDGIDLIGLGEMGIGNTTAASALTAVFTECEAESVTGRGTGIDETTWKRKVAVIDKALAVNKPSANQPLEALAKLGGFELAGLVGVILGAAAHKRAVVLDGFITGAAALVAVTLCPTARDYLIAAHQSVEPGHARVLDFLGLRPLLALDMRLGEGTGAALAMHLIEASLRILQEMATFSSAGVSSR